MYAPDPHVNAAAHVCTVMHMADRDDHTQPIADALTRNIGGTWHPWRPAPEGPALKLWVRTSDRDGRQIITGIAAINDSGIGASDLRKLPLGAIENAINLGSHGGPDDVEFESLPPLVRDPAIRPEDWSRLVAEHYKAWARRGSNPGAAISKRWGVNRQTVAAWVREARLRGFLPPARRTREAE